MSQLSLTGRDAPINVGHMDIAAYVAGEKTIDEAMGDDDAPRLGPGSAGFTRVTTRAQWSLVEPAYPLTVYRHERHGLNVSVRPGELWSIISAGRSNTTWDEAATRAGRVMVATADLPSYWAVVRDGRFPTFGDTFGDGCWAALAPFDTSAEADLSTWPPSGQPRTAMTARRPVL